MLRRLLSTSCLLGACALALVVSASATRATVNMTALAAICAPSGGEFEGPNWVWRSGDPNANGYGCVISTDGTNPPWTAQARRAQATCTAAGWQYYDFGGGTTFLYGYYGWGCRQS